MATQLENWCVRAAGRAGYEARASVWLTRDGALEKVQLSLDDAEAPLPLPPSLTKTTFAANAETQSKATHAHIATKYANPDFFKYLIFTLECIKFHGNYTSYCELCQVFTTDYIWYNDHS